MLTFVSLCATIFFPILFCNMWYAVSQTYDNFNILSQLKYSSLAFTSVVRDFRFIGIAVLNVLYNHNIEFKPNFMQFKLLVSSVV